MTFVQGPRAVLERYWGQPWKDVVGAAKMGVDGLKPAESETHDSDTFFLRELVCAGTREHGKAALMRQNW